MSNFRVNREKFKPVSLEESKLLEPLSAFSEAVFQVFYQTGIQKVDSQFTCDILNELISKGYLHGYYEN